jgi:hypothetical protein
MQGLFKKTKIDLKIHPTCETVKNTDVTENLRLAGVETNPQARPGGLPLGPRIPGGGGDTSHHP